MQKNILTSSESSDILDAPECTQSLSSTFDEDFCDDWDDDDDDDDD